MPPKRRASDRQDPLSRESLFRQVGALVGAVLLGFLSMAVREVSADRTGMLVQASTVTAATVIVTLIVPWGRLPNLAHTFIPFVFLLVAFLARIQAARDAGREAYSVRMPQRRASAPTPQMGLFQQPARMPQAPAYRSR